MNYGLLICIRISIFFFKKRRKFLARSGRTSFLTIFQAVVSRALSPGRRLLTEPPPPCRLSQFSPPYRRRLPRHHPHPPECISFPHIVPGTFWGREWQPVHVTGLPLPPGLTIHTVTLNRRAGTGPGTGDREVNRLECSASLLPPRGQTSMAWQGGTAGVCSPGPGGHRCETQVLAELCSFGRF